MKKQASSDRPTMAEKRGVKRQRELENTLDNLEGITSKISDSILPSKAAASGPTSFVGLIPSTAAPQANGPRPPRRIKTFQDVAQGATQTNATPAIIPLSQSDWLPPVMAPRPPKAGPRLADEVQATQEAAAAAAAMWNIDLLHPPMDWSAKQSLRFTSSQPFHIVDILRSAPRSEVIDAERNFAANAWSDAGCLPQQRLLSAAMTWAFPQNPLPPAPSRAIVASLSAQLETRRKDWQEALCSLYDALSSRQCSTFYILPPQLLLKGESGRGKHSFSVMFGVPGVGGRSRVHAIMGRSTAGVRDLLKLHGIGFEAPLLGKNRRAGGGGGGVEGTRTMLFFEGAFQVHALFDFLLNRTFGLAEEVCDVPVLLAPVQFTHASIKKYSFVASAGIGGGAGVRAGASSGSKHSLPTKDRSSKASATTDKLEPTLYQLEIKGGLVPPWVADRLLSLLSSTQESGSLTMYSDPLPASIPFNWHSQQAAAAALAPIINGTGVRDVAGNEEAAAMAQGGAAGVLGWGGGCASSEEATRWSTACPGLYTSAVREVTFNADIKGYRVLQTTARVLPIA